MMISSGLCDGGGEDGVSWACDSGIQTGQRAKGHSASIRATSQTEPSKALVFLKTLSRRSWVHRGLHHLAKNI